jgi:sec-independent protein translocase protein TatC
LEKTGDGKVVKSDEKRTDPFLGICFELPLVILVLAKLGIVTYEFLRQKRPYVIVIIFIVAAVITPTTDPLNQSLLAVPMCLLYEACIWIARWMERVKRKRSA